MTDNPSRKQERNGTMKKYWMGLAACMMALPVEAQTGIALAGVEAGNGTHSAYLGSVLPLPGSALGQGWVQRYWLDHTAYRYEKAPGQEIDARVAGVEAALGYQGSWEAGWWGAYLGARYGNTRLSPDDLANEDRGGDFSIKLQLEGESALSSRWRMIGNVSHLVGQSSYWSRLRLQTVSGNQFLIGPELVVQGDTRYRLYKLGLFVGGIRVGHDAALTLKAGASKLDSDSGGAYAGIEWYKPY
jgi:hypothetical protein